MSEPLTLTTGPEPTKTNNNNATAATKKVAVIGNGFAGSKFTAQAKAKHRDWDITVITPFDYQEVPLCMTEAIAAGPEVHQKCIYPLVREPGVTYLIDEVESLFYADNSLKPWLKLKQSDTPLNFDVVVVAVGQKIPIFYPNPATEGTRAAREAAIAASHTRIVEANHIVVAGGGAVGTEVAADIKLRFPTKSVTLVHGHEELLPSMAKPFRTLAAKQLTSPDINLTLKLSNRVMSYSETKHECLLQSGEVLPCDVFLSAHPEGGNAQFLPAASQTERHYAKVNECGQVTDAPCVFAIGDCTDYDTVKTVPRIDDFLPTLLTNVARTLSTKPSPLKAHVKGFRGQWEGPALVAFGHHHPKGTGVGVALPGCLGICCFVCCCFGGPCATPGGPSAAKLKADFNASISPKVGKGMDR